ncbi:MAG TPA: hypothetical protein VF865_19175 [Acidobacteriaceae bacterium]
MKKFLLALRMAVEGILGFLVLLTVPVSLLRVLAARSQESIAYLLGSLVGMILMLVLGIWLLKDAGRVFGRLKSSPPSRLA